MPNAVDASNLRRIPLEQPRPAPSASLDESPTGLPFDPSAPAQLAGPFAAGAMSDGYAQPSPSAGALVGVASQASPVAALVGDLSGAVNWSELPSRFASDFREGDRGGAVMERPTQGLRGSATSPHSHS